MKTPQTPKAIQALPQETEEEVRLRMMESGRKMREFNEELKREGTYRPSVDSMVFSLLPFPAPPRSKAKSKPRRRPTP